MNPNDPLNYWDLINKNPELFNNENALLKIVTDRDRVKIFQEKFKIELEKEGLPCCWSDIGIVYDDPYIVILRDLVEFPDGSLKPYSRLINRADLFGGQGVVIFPFFENKIIVLEQYRHATRSWHLEVPRGFGTAGLSSFENARKEIIEEIQGDIIDLKELGTCYNNTGMEGNLVQLFFANLQSFGKPEEMEGIKKIKCMDLVEFERLIENGNITDCFTITAYTRAKLRGYLN